MSDLPFSASASTGLSDYLFSFYPSSIPGEFLIGLSLMEAQEFGRSERGKDLKEVLIAMSEPFNCTIAFKKENIFLHVERC